MLRTLPLCAQPPSCSFQSLFAALWQRGIKEAVFFCFGRPPLNRTCVSPWDGRLSGSRPPIPKRPALSAGRWCTTSDWKCPRNATRMQADGQHCQRCAPIPQARLESLRTLPSCAQSPSFSFQSLFAALFGEGASKRQFFFGFGRPPLNRTRVSPQDGRLSSSHLLIPKPPALCRAAARWLCMETPTQRYKNAS